MEKKSLFWGLSLGAMCIFFITLFCNLIIQITHPKVNTALQANIENTLLTSEVIDFSKVTDFEWDTLYIFTPYSSPSEILKQDNITHFNTHYDIEHLDTIIMLGFVRNNRFISYVELSREYFADLPPTSIRFNKNTACFKVAPKAEYLSNAIYLY